MDIPELILTMVCYLAATASFMAYLLTSRESLHRAGVSLRAMAAQVSRPVVATLAGGATLQYVAVAKDQFNNPLISQPAITWNLTGIGSLSSSGLYTAPAASGTSRMPSRESGRTPPSFWLIR